LGRLMGLEPMTSRTTTERYYQLSYSRRVGASALFWGAAGWVDSTDRQPVNSRLAKKNRAPFIPPPQALEARSRPPPQTHPQAPPPPHAPRSPPPRRARSAPAATAGTARRSPAPTPRGTTANASPWFDIYPTIPALPSLIAAFAAASTYTPRQRAGLGRQVEGLRRRARDRPRAVQPLRVDRSADRLITRPLVRPLQRPQIQARAPLRRLRRALALALRRRRALRRLRLLGSPLLRRDLLLRDQPCGRQLRLEVEHVRGNLHRLLAPVHPPDALDPGGPEVHPSAPCGSILLVSAAPAWVRSRVC
jgi:hypothetical protein